MRYLRNINTGELITFNPDVQHRDWVPYEGKVPEKLTKGLLIIEDVSEGKFFDEAAPKKEVVEEEDDETRIVLLADAIKNLNAGDFASSGAPNVYALQRKAGMSNVTAEERDKAYELYLTLKKKEGSEG